MSRALCLFLLSLAIVALSVSDLSQAHDGRTEDGVTTDAASMCICCVVQDRVPGCATHQFIAKTKARTLKQKAARRR